MAKQKGRLMLLQIDVAGIMTTLVGITSNSLDINNSPIDVTTAPSDRTDPLWMESLSGAKQVGISGEATFIDETSETTLAAAAIAAEPFIKAQLVVPDYGTYACDTWHIDSFGWSAGVQDGTTFSVSLSSSGEVEFTAAA